MSSENNSAEPARRGPQLLSAKSTQLVFRFESPEQNVRTVLRAATVQQGKNNSIRARMAHVKVVLRPTGRNESTFTVQCENESEPV